MIRPAAVVALVLIVALLAVVVPLFVAPDDVDTYQLGAAPTSTDHLPFGFERLVAVMHDRTPPTAPSTTTTTERKSRQGSATIRRAASVDVYPTDDLLDRLAQCETGGTMDPTTNTGNGYYGAFQFTVETWWSVGGEGYPHEHPYAVQRDLARTLILQAGWSQFPTCSRVIGAR